MKKFLPLIMMLIMSNFLNAQTTTVYALEYDSAANLNYFISVDPSDGTVNQIDTIQETQYYDIHNAVLNSDSGYYIVTGNDRKIYTIDIITGAIINNPTLSAEIHELQYDHINNKYYALETEVSTNSSSSTGMGGAPIGNTTIMTYFVSVDNITGVVTRIDSINGVEAIQLGSSIINTNNNEYSFIAGKNVIYTLDLTTGTIISNPVLTTDINELQIDLANNSFYAIETQEVLGSSGTTSTSTGVPTRVYKTYLVAVNPTTGNVTRIDSVNGLGIFKPCTSNIDTVNGHFKIIDNQNKLFSINLSDAAVVTEPLLNANVINPTVKSVAAVVPEPLLGANVSTQKVKSLSESGFGAISTYPNPAKNKINVEVDQVPSQLEIYDYRGQKVMEQTLLNNRNTIDISDLNNGLFIFKVYNVFGQQSERILVQ